jgi:hypothetical protein
MRRQTTSWARSTSRVKSRMRSARTFRIFLNLVQRSYGPCGRREAFPNSENLGRFYLRRPSTSCWDTHSRRSRFRQEGRRFCLGTRSPRYGTASAVPYMTPPYPALAAEVRFFPSYKFAYSWNLPTDWVVVVSCGGSAIWPQASTQHAIAGIRVVSPHSFTGAIKLGDVHDR